MKKKEVIETLEDLLWNHKSAEGDAKTEKALSEAITLLKGQKGRVEHKLKGFTKDRTIYLDGKQLNPTRSQQKYNHSPDGFNWGYEGSGPAQLALAIIIELTGQAGGYQEFKRNVIAKIPQGKDFEILFWLNNNGEIIEGEEDE